ncbi:unnamed protein product [Cylindrotheca closterium]|uniref:CRAL-TRIO domain-containing protein n=1 Tax=Cylindrotheca closterium TaxID=2856 RepID=A0AAD2GAQ4_9STRA|nr:unnamed protein product [Cylindrotheca closterium]
MLSPSKTKNLLSPNKAKKNILRRLSTPNEGPTGATEEERVMSSSHGNNNSQSESTVLKALEEYCEKANLPFSKETIYRFAAFHKFHLAITKEALIENADNHHLNLEMKGFLHRQFSTRTVFPLSGLQTRKDKLDICYIQASRFPGPDNDNSGNHAIRVLQSLCYVLNDLSVTKEQCKKGVAVIINMKRCEEAKFSMDFWTQLMLTLQGSLVPTTVNLVLLVDGPKWFHSKIWKTQTKPMLVESFAKKCRLIDGDALLTGEHLPEGCEAHLPNAAGGWKASSEIIEDYQDLKTFQDQQREQGNALVQNNP